MYSQYIDKSISYNSPRENIVDILFLSEFFYILFWNNFTEELQK